MAGNERVEIDWKTDDDCGLTIDGKFHRFIRGVVLIPIIGSDKDFGVGAWTSVSEASYDKYASSFGDPDQSKIGKLTGYLMNRFPGYEETFGLPLVIVPQDNRKRPLLWVAPLDNPHPLARDQERGWDRARLLEFLSLATCGGSA
ncbi:MAG: DUF2199 domain-containing protein, partial [Pseudomonadota bacterium]